MILLLVILAGVGLYFLRRGKSGGGADSAYTTEEVTRRDISSEITGPGGGAGGHMWR